MRIGSIFLTEDDKKRIAENYLHGSTQAVYPSSKMDDLRIYVTKLEELYQRLETVDEITEDNPAFDMMCKFTEDFYICIENIKSILYDDSSRHYKWEIPHRG